ncbi:MAG: PrpR N-terminal domain-containing protein, partial [Oscillospiraceae bacterium]|nr:PrpR N-terminal domain-containing protein [Oscillospiraceae bacterium]
MAKVAILVPYEDMCELTRAIVNQYQHINPLWIEYTHTNEIEQRAAQLVQQGCELIVARGTQASAVKRSVHIPLVEMRVTTQELAGVILQLKKEINIPCPRIGLVGFANMIKDTSHFNELFEVELQSYLVESQTELPDMVAKALKEGCQGVVGGDIVCGTASRYKIPSRFIPAGVESIRDALRIASNMCYAIDLEKHNSAEIDAMLNHTSSGIMQVNHEGVLQRMNRVAYDLLEQRPQDIIGCHIMDIIPGLNQKILEDALYTGKEAYAFALDIRRKVVLMNIAPVQVDGENAGAIFTFHESQQIIEMSSELRRELYQRGFIARYNFDNIVCAGKESAAVVSLAKRISKFAAPILLTGEAGCGKGIMAQCVHNDSLLRNNAFVTMACSVWLPE